MRSSLPLLSLSSLLCGVWGRHALSVVFFHALRALPAGSAGKISQGSSKPLSGSFIGAAFVFSPEVDNGPPGL